MPDREGYLNDNEVLIEGTVWEVRDVKIPQLCEAWLNDEEECDEPAAVELHHWGDEDCHSTLALCKGCFEELMAKEKK